MNKVTLSHIFECSNITLDTEVFGRVMVAFCDYTLGRATYSLYVFQQILEENPDAVSDPYAASIISRIEGRIATGYNVYAKKGTNKYSMVGGLGMDFDAEAWLVCVRKFESKHAQHRLFELPPAKVEISVRPDSWWFAVAACLRVPYCDVSDEDMMAALAPIGLNIKWASNMLRDIDESDLYEKYPRLSAFCKYALKTIATNDYISVAHADDEVK